MKGFIAALMFFTRIPLWRWLTVPPQEFKHIVSYWSLAGWLTGGVMAGVYLLSSMVFSSSAAIILALIARLLLTGALHEDGFADFFDGFGGGSDRTSTLRIMKDSHIGSYGVLSLILYYLLAWQILNTLPSYQITASVLLVGDPLCKAICSFTINLLPYARKEEESKAKIIYNRLSAGECLISIIAGILPLCVLPLHFLPAIIVPIIVFALLIRLMRHKIGGYTGDCCGAAFIICEVSFWLACSGIFSQLRFY